MTKIEELKAAYEVATSGEWILFDSEASEGAKGVMVSGDFGMDVCSMSNTAHMGYENNDTFIALSHNLMPQLLEAVELLQRVYKNPDNILQEEGELYQMMEKLR